MPTTTAYTWHPSFRDETLVVLCPNHMSDWKAHYYSSDFPSSHHNNNNQIPDGGKRLDDVWKYLPSTLIHEFTHSLVLTQGRTNYQEPGNANSLRMYSITPEKRNNRRRTSFCTNCLTPQRIYV